MSKIMDNLYIGGAIEANDRNLLNSLKITDVWIVAKELPSFHPLTYNYKKIDARDNTEFNLSIYFNEMAEFIYQKIKKGSVFVHCMFGQSRSATAILAFLIKYENMNLKKSLIFLNSKRKVMPNKGFVNQLKEWENFIYKGKFNNDQKLEFNYKQFISNNYNYLKNNKNKSENFIRSISSNKNIFLASKDEKRNIVIKNNIINNYFISNKKQINNTKSMNKNKKPLEIKKIKKPKNNYLNVYKNNFNKSQNNEVKVNNNVDYNIYKTSLVNDKSKINLKKKNKKLKKDIINKNEEILNKNILSKNNLCKKINSKNWNQNTDSILNKEKNNSTSVLKPKNQKKWNKNIKSNINNLNSSNILKKWKLQIIKEDKKTQSYFCNSCKKKLFNDNDIKFHCSKIISQSICNYYFINENTKNFILKKENKLTVIKCKYCSQNIGEKLNNTIMCSCGNFENNFIRIKKRKIIIK